MKKDPDMTTGHSPIDLLRELVAIPSVNPELADRPEIGGEHRMVEWLEAWLSRRGFSTSRVGPDPKRPNLVARLGGADARRTLLFESHLDTVGVVGFSGDPFALREEQGRLYGRGACDTKGPLAAFLAAIDDEVLAALRASSVELVLLGAIGEETGNLGAEQAVADGLRADETIVLEPTQLRIVNTHKGACWFKAATRGRSAHGSDPGRGDNAILKMPAVWQAIEAATAEAARTYAPSGLGTPTVSLGTIHGGTGTNIVPDACAIQVDRRFLPGETCAAILEDIRARLADVPGGVEITLLKEGRAFHTDPEASLPQRLGQALTAAGLEASGEGAAWCSDAGVLADACRETVVWGPGSITQAHTANEYIESGQLAIAIEVLRHFLSESFRDI